MKALTRVLLYITYSYDIGKYEMYIYPEKIKYQKETNQCNPGVLIRLISPDHIKLFPVMTTPAPTTGADQSQQPPPSTQDSATSSGGVPLQQPSTAQDSAQDPTLLAGGENSQDSGKGNGSQTSDKPTSRFTTEDISNMMKFYADLKEKIGALTIETERKPEVGQGEPDASSKDPDGYTTPPDGSEFTSRSMGRAGFEPQFSIPETAPPQTRVYPDLSDPHTLMHELGGAPPQYPPSYGPQGRPMVSNATGIGYAAQSVPGQIPLVPPGAGATRYSNRANASVYPTPAVPPPMQHLRRPLDKMTESALKDVKIPTFSGKRGDFRSWMSSIVEILQLKEVQREEWPRITRAHVRESAREFLLMHDPYMTWDFSTMMQALHREYQLEDPTSSIIYLSNIRQGEKEPVARFLERLEKAYYDAYPTTHVEDAGRHRTLCCYALQGLRSELRDRLSAKSATGNFSEFKENLKTEEAFVSVFTQGRPKRAAIPPPMNQGMPVETSQRGLLRVPKAKGVTWGVSQINEDEKQDVLQEVIRHFEPKLTDLETTVHTAVDEIRQATSRIEEHPNHVGPQAEQASYDRSNYYNRNGNQGVSNDFRPRTYNNYNNGQQRSFNSPNLRNNTGTNMDEEPTNSDSACRYCKREGHFWRDCKRRHHRYGAPSPAQAVQTRVTLQDELTEEVVQELRTAQVVDPYDPIQPDHPLNSKRMKMRRQNQVNKICRIVIRRDDHETQASVRHEQKGQNKLSLARPK